MLSKKVKVKKASLGFIYIAASIRDVNLLTHHSVKIGMTKNPKRRLSEYKTYDRGITFIHIHECNARCMKGIENDVHKILTSIGCRVLYENEPRKGERFHIKNVEKIEELIKTLDYTTKTKTPIIKFNLGKYVEIDVSKFPREIPTNISNVYDEDQDNCSKCNIIASVGTFIGICMVGGSIYIFSNT